MQQAVGPPLNKRLITTAIKAMNMDIELDLRSIQINNRRCNDSIYLKDGACYVGCLREGDGDVVYTEEVKVSHLHWIAYQVAKHYPREKMRKP